MEYQVGFSGEQFSSNLLSGWDHHALEKVKLKKKKKMPFFPPIGKCLKWHKIGFQESAPSLRKTKSSQHQDPAKRGGQFVLLQ